MNRYLRTKWEYFKGSSAEFSFENRMTNSICVITFIMVFLLLIFNVSVSFFEEAFICVAVLMVIIVVYYQSRFRKKYKAGATIYAITSYGALATAFYYNSGINGPTIILFFLSFQVLITVTPKSQHILWAILHTVSATALCLVEYWYPDLIADSYPDRSIRFADIIFTYVVCLIFMYLITMTLRNNLDRIRKKSIERAEAIQRNLHEIEQQNEKLKEISWLQSHKVRSQVATILGLSQFIHQSNINDPDLNRVIGGIKEAAKDLDAVIKEINRLTHNADLNKDKPSSNN